jgi:hypothetical protein
MVAEEQPGAQKAEQGAERARPPTDGSGAVWRDRSAWRSQGRAKLLLLTESGVAAIAACLVAAGAVSTF